MAREGKKMLEDAMNEEMSLPLTPMIDVVFQLLIFFLFAMKFSGYEGRLYAKLPTNRGLGYEGTPPITLQEVRIKLLWVQKGNWSKRMLPEDYEQARKNPGTRAWWEQNGMTVLKIRDDFLMKGGGLNSPEAVPDWNALLARIKKGIQNFKPTKSYPTLPVIIEGYQLVPFQHVVSALNVCVKAGVKDITFAAPEIPF
ncbi:MAG: biopolymer transporter ExbD [Planctomycetota bacterium]|nr:biopolymer transporter ExbD [Planctomycetota bacterium]